MVCCGPKRYEDARLTRQQRAGAPSAIATSGAPSAIATSGEDGHPLHGGVALKGRRRRIRQTLPAQRWKVRWLDPRGPTLWAAHAVIALHRGERTAVHDFLYAVLGLGDLRDSEHLLEAFFVVSRQPGWQRISHEGIFPYLAWISTAANSPDKGLSRTLARYAVSSSVAPFHQGTATCC